MKHAVIVQKVKVEQLELAHKQLLAARAVILKAVHHEADIPGCIAIALGEIGLEVTAERTILLRMNVIGR